MYSSGKERDFMPNLRKIEAAVPAIREKKKVAAYARVSMQSERMLHSLSAQVSYYSGLIQKNPDWEYAGVYADDFISGTNTVKRDEFKRMLADCEAGKDDGFNMRNVKWTFYLVGNKFNTSGYVEGELDNNKSHGEEHLV